MSRNIVAMLFVLLSLSFLVNISSFTAQTQTTINISAKIPDPNALVFFKEHYVMIVNKLKAFEKVNVSKTSDIENTTVKLTLNSSIFYNNTKFNLPFGETFASGYLINGEVVFYVIGHEINTIVRYGEIDSVLSGIISNTTLYRIVFNGISINYTPIIKNANLSSVLTNGKIAFVLEQNNSEYRLIEIEGTKVISSYPINITGPGVELVAFNSNYVDLSRILSGRIVVSVYNLKTLSVVKTLYSDIVPSTVYNSNSSIFLTYQVTGLGKGEVSVVNSSGYVLADISVIGSVMDYVYNAIMYNNSLLSLISVSPTYTLTNYIYNNGEWLKYDTITFHNSPNGALVSPVGIENYPHKFKVIVESLLYSPTYINIAYSFLTVPYSKPEKPLVSLKLFPYPKVTQVLLTINEPNATLLGVNKISVYSNSTLVKVNTLGNSKEVKFNVTRNGTYIITVVASNIFGNATTSIVKTITVKPPVETTTTTTATTTTTTATTSSTTTTFTTSTTSALTNITTVHTPTSGIPVSTYLAVAGIVIVIAIIILLLFRRRK